MQRLQTIIATNTAEPIIRSLPQDLHPYIYKFISDEVKLHYWMEKYDLENTGYFLVVQNQKYRL